MKKGSIKSLKDMRGKKSPTKKEKFKTPEVKPKAGEKPFEAEFPVVGMGASAGGLEAFEQFFAKMPHNSGMAFVIVSHLAPAHKSLMPDLLRKYTKMNLHQVEDGMEVRPNTIYIIPPNKDIIISKGALLLMEPEVTQGIRHPINVFFRSLAGDLKEKAVCIVFSGTGTEGTLGLQAVKAEGGFVIVQSPESASYDSMPRSAIATGLADLILPPEKMPNELLKHARQSLRVARMRPKEVPDIPPDYLKKIFVLIREHTGNDFSEYKQSTINRRVEKRMFIHGIEKIEDYVRFLQQNPDEIRFLFKEFLISVTKFFRDPEAFEALKKEIIPELIGNKLSDQPVRVWVVGCTTGEEAYSIAMLFKEHMDENLKNKDVQIFATDIDNDAIEKARAGVFQESIHVDVSPERLRRFFIKEKNTFRIRKDIREMIVFSIQNVIKDPPFSKLDLISCRNLLIYMNPKLQKKVLPVFHYGLNRNGFLVLGNSETVGDFADLFSVIDRQWKIYRRKGEFAEIHRGLNMTLPVIEHAYAQGMKGKMKGLERQVPEILEKMLLDLYAPPCVIVNDKLEIRYFHGRTGKYLEPAPGEAKHNLIDMAREGLKTQLYHAAFEAQKQRSDITVKNIHVKTDGEIQNINLVVKPVRDVESLKSWLIVIFDEIGMPAGQTRKRVSYKGKDATKRIGELEQELKNSKESLQITIEELETSNEELKSTNEELQSSNEELQSTNEELETSREELQSLNEELANVNSELQYKNQELSQANSDMNNILDSMNIAAVFLDNSLRIKRFTPAATDIANLIQSDVGRPFSDISAKLIYEDMMKDIKGVLQSLLPIEREVRSKSGAWFLTRIMPYRTVENVIDGVIITFVNITEIARLKAAEKSARLYAEGIVNTVREPLVILNKDLRVVSANKSFYRAYNVSKGNTEGTLVYELGERQWDIPSLRELLENILPERTSFEDFKMEHDFPKIGMRKMLLNARQIVHDEGEPMILLAIEDVTGLK